MRQPERAAGVGLPVSAARMTRRSRPPGGAPKLHL